MSAVTNQPLPFDRLEREKHIQMIFRAFRNHCGPSSEGLTHSSGPKPQQMPLDWDPDEQPSHLAPGRKMENTRRLGKVNRLEMEEEWPEGAAGSNVMSELEAVSEIHITARPELQGALEVLILCISMFLQRRFVCFKIMKLCHGRSAVCSPEDLQHHHRRQQVSVIRGC